MIKIIKLVSGESIIGELEADSIDPAVVYDPMVIDIYKDEDDNSHMRLVTANALSSEEHLVFEKKHVLTFYQPQDILVEYYHQVRHMVSEDKVIAEEKIGEALDRVKGKKVEIEEFYETISTLFAATKETANTNFH
jgi:hypothetical protein